MALVEADNILKYEEGSEKRTGRLKQRIS